MSTDIRSMQRAKAAPKQSREVGILFRGDMIRAILAGAKTETRRRVKLTGLDPSNPYPDRVTSSTLIETKACLRCGFGSTEVGGDPCLETIATASARWRPGDTLWCRETWTIPGLDFDAPGADPEKADRSLLRYRADGERVQVPWLAPGDLVKPTWRPSIFLFRWACRITLPVLSVRAERLTAITDAGAVAEGFVHAGLGSTAADYCREYRRMHGLAEDADPWVWVVGFGPPEVSNG